MNVSGSVDECGGRIELVPLAALAKTIRSKNAGPDGITFDIIFGDDDVYDYVKATGLVTRQRIAELYRVDEARIVQFGHFDPARAIKFTIRRRRPSGSPGEPDVMGSQMYAPLLELEVPAPAELVAEPVA